MLRSHALTADSAVTRLTVQRDYFRDVKIAEVVVGLWTDRGRKGGTVDSLDDVVFCQSHTLVGSDTMVTQGFVAVSTS